VESASHAEAQSSEDFTPLETVGLLALHLPDWFLVLSSVYVLGPEAEFFGFLRYTIPIMIATTTSAPTPITIQGTLELDITIHKQNF
jgi:hypothetical protein